ncbi:MAG: hypothetical protein ACOVO9_07920 [Bacteroidia bacterium]
MRNLFKLSLVFMVVFLFGCKKEETTTTTSPTTKELITSAAWKVNSYSTTSTDAEILAEVKSWNDDLKTSPLTVTYKTDGTYSYSDGNDNGTWELSGDKKIIYGKGTADEISSTIDKLTSNSFVITYPFEAADSVVVSITETCSR